MAHRRTILIVLWLAVASACGPSEPQRAGAYEGTRLDGAAPDFRLLDQRGQPTSLADFRGRVVVLTFMDSRCREVCPRTASHLRRAASQLGAQNDAVAFVAVNVNREANAVEDVARASAEWRLDEMPSWRFLTGTPEELSSAWSAYGVGVVPPIAPGDELVHGSGVFLVGRSGELRWYISVPSGEDAGSAFTPLDRLLLRRIQELLQND